VQAARKVSDILNLGLTDEERRRLNISLDEFSLWVVDVRDEAGV